MVTDPRVPSASSAQDGRASARTGMAAAQDAASGHSRNSSAATAPTVEPGTAADPPPPDLAAFSVRALASPGTEIYGRLAAPAGRAAEVAESLLASPPSSAIEEAAVRSVLALALCTRWLRERDNQYLVSSIDQLHRAIDLVHDEHPFHARLVELLYPIETHAAIGSALLLRALLSGGSAAPLQATTPGKGDDLSNAIDLLRKVEAALPADSTRRPDVLGDLGLALLAGDLTQATGVGSGIETMRAAVAACPPGHPRRASILLRTAAAVAAHRHARYAPQVVDQGIEQRLLAAPAVSQIAATLRALEIVALVYLIPASGAIDGCAVIVRADGAVSRILNQARARKPGSPGGLVVLAACTSDLTVAHYEALTLSSAFLAAGAVGVIGARSEVSDLFTALLMFMLHRHLLEHPDESPACALRAAQLWMLDPQREIPAEMPKSLAAQARRLAVSSPFAWAAFTYHGQ